MNSDAWLSSPPYPMGQPTATDFFKYRILVIYTGRCDWNRCYLWV